MYESKRAKFRASVQDLRGGLMPPLDHAEGLSGWRRLGYEAGKLFLLGTILLAIMAMAWAITCTVYGGPNR